MNYKILLYVFNIMLSIFAISSINFEKIIKKNKVMEIKILGLILSFIMAYLLTNFIYDFISIS